LLLQDLDEKWTVWNSRSAKVENNNKSTLTLDNFSERVEGGHCSVTFIPQENLEEADDPSFCHSIDPRCFGLQLDQHAALRRLPINRKVEVDIIRNDNGKDMVVILRDNAGGMTQDGLKGECCANLFTLLCYVLFGVGLVAS
jgi:hypothetical protein